MKQHIDIAQLKQLTKDEQNKLRSYFWDAPKGPHSGEDYYSDNLTLGYGMIPYPIANWIEKKDYIPLPSIGQMIEFLDEHYENEKSPVMSLSIERGNKGWILWESGDEEVELCDALWEAVKEVLKQ